MNKIKLIVISLVVLSSTIKQVLTSDDVAIKVYENEINENGEYHFRFVQSDGTRRDESGKFEGEGNYVVRGYYSYIDPSGNKQHVEYYADSTGYHPKKPARRRPSDTNRISVGPAALASLLG